MGAGISQREGSVHQLIFISDAMISQLGRYEIISELGQGAMGVVYKARDPLIERLVAIKTINLSLAQEEKEEYEARFYQEAKAAGRLSHPNIVTIYDVGKCGDIAYIAMEFLEGRELRDILDDGRHLPVDQVLDLVAQVARGLAYAHENGVVHRDVKPANIMVVRDDHVKITDFGIARMATSAVRTQTGMVLGSPKYMSPEQVMGKKIDQRSDVFSLGVMLYEMLAGQAPFAGENINAIMYQTLNTVPPPPSTLNPAVPEMLDFIVAKALAKNVDDRYPDASEFAMDLRACRDTMPRSRDRVGVVNPPPPSRTQIPDAIPAMGLAEADAEESKPVATMGLSALFDSSEATMRLAAMTTSPEETEAVAKTLKVGRITDTVNINAIPTAKLQAGARPTPAPVSQGEAERKPSKSGNLLLIIIVLLVLAGVVSLFFF